MGATGFGSVQNVVQDANRYITDIIFKIDQSISAFIMTRINPVMIAPVERQFVGPRC